LIGILTGIYSGDKITTDVQLFEFFQAYAPTIAVGIVVILTFFLF
jgi:putative hemolysin